MGRESQRLGVLRRELHFLLQTLWSKAVGTDTYDKKEWMALQNAIYTLEGFTPPDPLEPAPYRISPSDDLDDPCLEDSDDTVVCDLTVT